MRHRRALHAIDADEVAVHVPRVGARHAEGRAIDADGVGNRGDSEDAAEEGAGGLPDDGVVLLGEAVDPAAATLRCDAVDTVELATAVHARSARTVRIRGETEPLRIAAECLHANAACACADLGRITPDCGPAERIAIDAQASSSRLV